MYNPNSNANNLEKLVLTLLVRLSSVNGLNFLKTIKLSRDPKKKISRPAKSGMNLDNAGAARNRSGSSSRFIVTIPIYSG